MALSYLSSPLGFIRLSSGPIDRDAVFNTTAERLAYLTNAVRYAGQTVFDRESEKLYVLNDAENAWIEVGSGAGVTSFESLSDTPGTYVGSPNYILRVNNAQDAIEFVPLSTIIDADNGLSLIGNAVNLGGALTQLTSIELSTFPLSISTNNATPGSINFDILNNASSKHTIFNQTSDNISLFYDSGTQDVEFNLGIDGSQQAARFIDQRSYSNRWGIQYMGFDETGLLNDTGVDYSNLKFNSLIPLRVMEDAVQVGTRYEEFISISTSAINITASNLLLDPSGVATTADIDTINWTGQELPGKRIILIPYDDTDVITIKHNQGNIYLNGGQDITLTGNQQLVLYYDAEWSQWTDTFIESHINISSELTIATGAITVTQARHTIDTEADAATDDLDTINDISPLEGKKIILQAEDATRTVVIKHGTGNIFLNGGNDITLDDTTKQLELIYNGTNWTDVSFGAFNLTNGQGTTANGSAVDLGGTATTTRTIAFDPGAGFVLNMDTGDIQYNFNNTGSSYVYYANNFYNWFIADGVNDSVDIQTSTTGHGIYATRTGTSDIDFTIDYNRFASDITAGTNNTNITQNTTSVTIVVDDNALDSVFSAFINQADFEFRLIDGANGYQNSIYADYTNIDIVNTRGSENTYMTLTHTAATLGFNGTTNDLSFELRYDSLAGDESADAVFNDGRVGAQRKSIQLLGYGETDINTIGAAIYTNIPFNGLIPREYADSRIASQAVDTLVRTPTVNEDGYAIVWNNGTVQWELTGVITSVDYQSRKDVQLAKNISTTQELPYEGPRTFDATNTNAFVFNLNQIDSIAVPSVSKPDVDKDVFVIADSYAIFVAWANGTTALTPANSDLGAGVLPGDVLPVPGVSEKWTLVTPVPTFDAAVVDSEIVHMIVKSTTV